MAGVPRTIINERVDGGAAPEPLLVAKVLLGAGLITGELWTPCCPVEAHSKPTPSAIEAPRLLRGRRPAGHPSRYCVTYRAADADGLLLFVREEWGALTFAGDYPYRWPWPATCIDVTGGRPARIPPCGQPARRAAPLGSVGGQLYQGPAGVLALAAIPGELRARGTTVAPTHHHRPGRHGLEPRVPADPWLRCPDWPGAGGAAPPQWPTTADLPRCTQRRALRRWADRWRRRASARSDQFHRPAGRTCVGSACGRAVARWRRHARLR